MPGILRPLGGRNSVAAFQAEREFWAPNHRVVHTSGRPANIPEALDVTKSESEGFRARPHPGQRWPAAPIQPCSPMWENSVQLLTMVLEWFLGSSGPAIGRGLPNRNWLQIGFMRRGI